MPIKPENKALYPTNWKSEIRPRILARAGNCCEKCGVRNHAYGYRGKAGLFVETDATHSDDDGFEGERRIIRIVLTIAHLHDMNPANCADDNLAALCQRCHNIHDMTMRQANAAATRRAKAAAGDLFGQAEVA